MGLPDVNDVALFAAIGAVALVGGIVLVWAAGRARRLERSRSLVRVLSVLTVVQVAAWIVFGLADACWLAVGGYWLTQPVRLAVDPLFLVWVNRGLEPASRATVLPMVSQANAGGQIVGGPVMGIVAALRTVRVVLVAAALILVPALGAYAREWGAGGEPVEAERDG